MSLISFLFVFFLLNPFLFPQDKGTDSTESKQIVVLSIRDSGLKNSEPITVKSPWQLLYYNGSDGSAFSIYLHRLDGKFESVLVSTAEGGEGKTYCYKSGKFYLSIMGFGDWSVKVVQEE